MSDFVKTLEVLGVTPKRQWGITILRLGWGSGLSGGAGCEQLAGP